MTTIADKIEGLGRWLERVEATDDDYATDEWKDRAREKIGRIGSIYQGLGLDGDTALPTLQSVAYGDTSQWFSAAERQAILWQFRHHLALSEFKQALLSAVEAADDTNLDRLALGFPDLVEGVRRWRNESGFAERIDALLDR